MKSRLDLHAKLCDIIGSNKVYYQPPESVKISYPCIVYNRAGKSPIKADNTNYLNYTRYTVTLITKDADSPFIDEILSAFSYCDYDRNFKSDNLYHDVFDLYY